jgi:carbamoyl-phosphate synthase small subunit
MIEHLEKQAILLLEDGTFYYGKPNGAIGTTTGEIAFNTGMTGYQEIFTDPSYYGQIIVMATSHIGNYGVHPTEIESDGVKIAGMVCKKFSNNFSRPAANDSLQTYFEKENVVGISEIDTRSLLRHIRNKGAMNAIISSEINDMEELKKILAKVPSMNGLELSSKVSTKTIYKVGNADARLRVALLDYGVKKNIIRCLVERGCFVTVYPMDTSATEILETEPDGIMLSNGPGDPAPMKKQIEELKILMDSKVPKFGICLGHQLMAISQGLITKKMFNGHRGINHPIKNLVSGKCEITSQNHGFVVDMETSKENKNIEITHIHLNDETLAGLKFSNKNAFSVQFHPEASPGPKDSRYLFDEFVTRMTEFKEKAPKQAVVSYK